MSGHFLRNAVLCRTFDEHFALAFHFGDVFLTHGASKNVSAAECKDTDTLDIVPKLAEKCAGLRIFKDENDKLNLSAKDLGYSALVVSQFTLYGDTKKGFRPSFIKAARPPLAVDAYELFLAEMNKQGLKDVQHGEFGADMQVSLVNEGPCTIVIDTDEWHKGEK